MTCLRSRSHRLLAGALGALLVASTAHAQLDDGSVPDYVRVRASLDRESYAPGDVAKGTIEMRIDPRVHINAHVPSADYQYPTDLGWDETSALEVSDIAWPKPALKAFEFTDGEKIAVLEGTQRATFTVTVPKDAAPGELKLVGTFRAQGCTHTTCYAPQMDEVSLVVKVAAAGAAATPPASATSEPAPVEGVPSKSASTSAVPPSTPPSTEEPDEIASSEPAAPGHALERGTTASTPEEPAADEPEVATVGAVPTTIPEAPDGHVEKAFDCPVAMKGPADKPLLWVFLASFVGGLLLTFTPCVLPLVPITIGFFSRQQAQGGRPVVPALLYVLGLALVYSALGTFAALTGGLFGQALQNPWVLAAIAAVLLALALSMFGLWDMQLPNFIQSRIGGGKSGPLGAAMMGGAMGLIAAPCVGPFVVSLLTYVAELGSRMPVVQAAMLGGALFFVLALGLGLPFFLVALGVGSIRPGEWMVTVKKIFGFIIFGVVLWFLRPIIGAAACQWGIVLVLLAAAVFFIMTAKGPTHGPRLRWGLTALGALAGVAALTTGVVVAKSSAGEAGQVEHQFKTYSQAALDEARSGGRPVVIDFTADWCIACEELASQTFVASNVQDLFGEFTLLKADLTNDQDPAVRALYKQHSIRGLPTIMFLDSTGKEIRDLRLEGFEKPAEFADRLRCVTSFEVAHGG